MTSDLLPPGGRPDPVTVYLAGLARGPSRAAQKSALGIIARILGQTDARAVPWAQLRYEHMAALRSKLAEQYAPATANRILTAARSVLEAAWKMGRVTHEDYQRARSVEAVPGSRLPPGRQLTREELDALLAVPDLHDRAVVAVFAGGGFRLFEVAKMKVADYAGGKITVIGKRNKERAVPLRAFAVRAVEDWLAAHPGGLSLFGRRDRTGRLHVSDHPPSISTIYRTVLRCARGAGVKLSTHDFRRTFISDLLDHGADLSIAKRLAGHEDPKTTSRYDRRGERAAVDAVRRLD